MNSYWIKELTHDKTGEMIEEKGGKVTSRFLTEEQFIDALNEKLTNEAKEVAAATTKDDKINELSDILEIVESYRKKYAITEEELKNFHNDKRTKRGGYDDHLYIEYIEVPVGSHFDVYCKSNPKKYKVKD